MTVIPGLLDALLAVQAEAPTLKKDRTAKIPTKNGGEYSYSYAALDGIVETVRPLLTKNGLVWSAKPSWMENVGPSLKYKLAHAPSREFEEGEMPLMLAADQAAQDMGSAITYMRRYALCAVLDLVADTDDDGALASSGRARSGDSTPASDKQRKFLRSLITKNRLGDQPHVLRRLFEGAGVVLAEGATVNATVDVLTKGQCSLLIETIKDGPVRDGSSDVPGAGGDEFTHPSVEPDPAFDDAQRTTPMDVGPS
jgi:hypothetical protein